MMSEQQGNQSRSISDAIVLVVFLAATLITAWLLYVGKGDEYREIIYSVLVASSALGLRWLFDLPTNPRWRSKILSETLLAVATGAVASGLVVAVALPKRTPPARTESYEVTWTFSDSSKPGMLQMQYTQLSQRVGKHGEPFWTKTFFEPYLWTTGVVAYSVQCANDKTAFSENSPTQPIHVPVISRGFYLELDTNDPAHAAALCAKDGDKKWVRIRATVDVPETYWDVAAGLVKLGQPPEFRMEDRTSHQNLAFVMAGPDDLYTHNIGPGNTITRHDLQFPQRVATGNPVRCQVYWYPLNTLSADAPSLITNRFRYAPK